MAVEMSNSPSSTSTKRRPPPIPFASNDPGVLTMSSREIAELTGKEHKNVIRDIRVMLDELEDGSNLSHVRETKDSRGYTSLFNLPKDLTITLVSGYNVQMRHRIVTRWMELEEKEPEGRRESAGFVDSQPGDR